MLLKLNLTIQVSSGYFELANISFTLFSIYCHDIVKYNYRISIFDFSFLAI